MRMKRHRSALATVAGVAVVAVIAAGCSTSGSSSAESSSSATDCSAYDQYGTFDNKTVTAYSSIRDEEAQKLEESWADFEKCTGIKISHEGAADFEAQLNVRVDGGNAPDLAFVPQPGLVQRFAQAGKLIPAPDAVQKNVADGWSEDWQEYASVDGTLYASPLMASVKSFVWYSPSMFADAGYDVPTTWDELMDLTEKIADTGEVPWCAGFASGDASGWPGTDWLEELMLRVNGADVYDQWVGHEIPFNDPQVAAALDKAGDILKNDAYVNGGYGDVKSIASIDFKEGGLPILDNQCWLHQQASFYAGMWGEDVTIGKDGDVFAFYEPPVKDDGVQPVEAAGEFVVAYRDAPEVDAVRAYLSSADWANNRVKLGGVVSANKGLKESNVNDPLSKLAVELLQDPSTVIRFDASDSMPASVGTGTFWSGMIEWISGADTQTVLNNIEKSWPTS